METIGITNYRDFSLKIRFHRKFNICSSKSQEKRRISAKYVCITFAQYCIYADFEAITEKIDGCHPSDQRSYTTAYQSHQGCGYCYKLICHYDREYSKPAKIYRGGDAIEKFIRQIFEELKDCQRVVQEKVDKP